MESENEYAEIFTDDDSLESLDGIEDEIMEEEGEEAEEEEEEGMQTEEVGDVPEWQFVQAGMDAVSNEAEFLGTPGVRPDWRPPASADGNEEEFLRLYLTDGIIASVKTWTNRRAWKIFEECADEEQLPKLVKNWKDCTDDEVRKLFGIVLLMGLDKKPEISSYWSQDPVFHCSFLSMPNALSRDRFKQLLSCLRFYDCTDVQEGPLAKIQPFLHQLQRVCSNNYMPRQHISVDETLVLYKGRLLFKQYIPTKRSRYGVKLYCLCESETGYLWNFAVHSTEHANAQFGLGLECGGLSISERIVAELCRELLHMNYNVFTDSWFTSHRLAVWLLANGTRLTGTVRSNRGVPQLLQQLQLRPTAAAFARNGEVLACKFVDRKSSGTKTVYLLDTAGQAACVNVPRVRRGGEQQVIAKPVTVVTYSKSMGGVDRMDSAANPYLASRKTLRWFQKLAFYLLLLLVRNSWIVYRQHGGTKTFVAFLRKAVSILVEETGRGRRHFAVRAGRPAAVGPAGDGPAVQHLPTKAPLNAANVRPRNRCRVCSENRIAKKTVYICPDCPGVPALCIGQCFRNWHSQPH
ncbi:hypothetical protein BOX15_Mlig002331g1 [Macrostomum lignano]|uniref:Uncharacterized protein n=1 Tax=Macrostomum lignano TaxID=282301 RepID=A0A267GLC7_9PLAT|nr:hypothetical protein BOX15_Mlig002331g1 [Macrostomum lignano]